MGSSPQVLSTFTWSDNFNGVVIGGFSARSNWLHPLDSASGVGGITVTSINGVPQTPPRVSCTATPNTLWPPNGKAVSVNISGIATSGTQNLDPSGGTFAASDTERQIQSSGAVTIGAEVNYFFTVPLIASRSGSDKASRQYRIVVTVRDKIGNVGSCSTIVTVPHDQGH
jgi:hypothetical protein